MKTIPSKIQNPWEIVSGNIGIVKAEGGDHDVAETV
jgi:hypothetical protein